MKVDLGKLKEEIDVAGLRGTFSVVEGEVLYHTEDQKIIYEIDALLAAHNPNPSVDELRVAAYIAESDSLLLEALADYHRGKTISPELKNWLVKYEEIKLRYPKD